MKVLVLGATGATGRLIVRDATAGGHHVVALVRAQANSNLPRAEVIEGDVRDEGTLVSALSGCDAVVSALGTGMGFRDVDLLTVATRALVAAMTRTGVRRLICISALGVGDSRHHGGFVFDRLFQPLLLGPAYKDKDRQEAAIRTSPLDWVIVRPAMLTNGAPRGRVRATTDLDGVNGGKIARRRRSIRGRATDDRHLVTAHTRHPVVKGGPGSLSSRNPRSGNHRAARRHPQTPMWKVDRAPQPSGT